MELEEAASRIQTLLNFHRGLLKLQEVVETARIAEQLQQERSRAAEAARIDLVDAQGKLADFHRASKRAMEQTNSALNSLNSAHTARIAELDLALATQETKVRQAMQESTDKHVSYMLQLADEEKAAQTRVDELNKKIATLEKAFLTLQSKAANLGA